MGIGRAIAKALAAEGVQVVAAARRIELMEAMADEVEASQHPRPILVKQDVMEEDAAARLSAAALDALGRIDILVNNAGASWGAPAEKLPLEAWNKVMNLNATSVFALSQAVANRCFIPQRSGNIIIIASSAALHTSMEMKAAPYYASKAAALHLTRALAAEWGPYGIRVNALCPGFFPSKLASGLLETIGPSVIARTPLGRLGGDTDLQGAAVYLASEASRHVTGQYIGVDGGASCA
jgi:gluconate 5-dehydrogenase